MPETAITFKPLREDGQQELVPLNLPEGLHEYLSYPLSYPVDRTDLDQDYAAYRYDDGTLLDVHFGRSYDPNGHFYLIHFGKGIGNGRYDDGILIIKTRDIEEIARTIETYRPKHAHS